jgi:hypothetical protein
MGAGVRLFWGSTDHGLNPEVAQEIVVPHPWLRVTKRFLLPGMDAGGKGRFNDLFRVTYQVDPSRLVAASREVQPELYAKMSAEFLESLSGQLEMFEDVDVVVDASLGVAPAGIGPGGPAVGEERMRPETLCRWDGSQDLAQWLGDAREIAMVGSGTRAQDALLALDGWIRTAGNRVFLITADAEPFKDSTHSWHARWSELQTEHVRALETHARELQEWEQLDDFIRAKKPAPAWPVPPVVVFSGHIASALDQLVDRSRTFITCEKIPWVEGLVQPENNGLELKTLAVDRVIGAGGPVRPRERFAGLDLAWDVRGKGPRDPSGAHPEKGFLSMPATLPVSAVMAQLRLLFSPRSAP